MNNKIQKLIESGLSEKTLKNLSEGQINQLYKRMVSEQVKGAVVMKKGTDPTQIKSYTDKGINVTMVEKELEEDETDDVTDSDALGATALQGYTGQEAPHDANDMAPDGMGDDSDDNREMMGMSEEKKNEPNPWAICHTQVGPKKTRKFERCVMAVKKQLEEGKNPVSLFLESQIQKIVEKHMPPKITKGDLMKYISENSPSTAPSPTPSTSA